MMQVVHAVFAFTFILLPIVVNSTVCSGSVTLTAWTGSFASNSANSTYSNYLYCYWLIQPTGPVASITVTFSQFETETGYDSVTIYAGTSAAGTQVFQRSGDLSVPPLTINGSSIYVSFRSDGSVVYSGFQAFYSASTVNSLCSGFSFLTASEGAVSVGSIPYANNVACQWLIQPSAVDVQFIAIAFSVFSTSSAADNVKIYSGTSASGTLITTMSGDYDRLPAVTVQNSAAYVTWTSGSASTSLGFVARYQTNSCIGTSILTATSGNITDGSGPYSGFVRCIWQINAASSVQSITLTFRQFSLYSGHDTVTVYAGTTSTGYQVASLTGDALPSPVIINGKVMSVVFTGYYSGAGFDAYYTTSTSTSGLCDGLTTLSDTSASLTSGPPRYVPNMSCAWLIRPTGTATSTQSIRFTINYAGAQAGDVLAIYSGTSANGTAVRTITDTGYTSGSEQVSGTSSYVTWTTTSTTTGNLGFSLSYVASPLCARSAVLSEPTGVFGSGPQSGNYTSGMSCSWTITPSTAIPSQVIIIFFAAGFSTEPLHDYVTVYTGTAATSANRVTRISGSYPSGATVTVAGASAYVTFRSDYDDDTSSGFTATYQVMGQYCIDALPLTAASGTISSGSATTYTNNMNCTWSIVPFPVAAFMSFTLTRLDTQLNTDVVRLYMGTNSSGVLIATYSGSTLPATVVLKTPAIFVHWTSDASIVNSGFSASYVGNLLSSYCSGSTVYTWPTGSMSSGPSPYFENMTCAWRISIPGAMLITFSDFDTAPHWKRHSVALRTAT
eukprot:TRINITY_DN4295_c0_g3_i1.p1 TRINITY_DN4295_c0_g3~~TRINITY_DN4295_c0_g3_i1.p1  ORF type:complete len:783 (-),score=135.76 TRINITY_DN4295_c0_g3_i1:2557-4905(-)